MSAQAEYKPEIPAAGLQPDGSLPDVKSPELEDQPPEIPIHHSEIFARLINMPLGEQLDLRARVLAREEGAMEELGDLLLPAIRRLALAHSEVPAREDVNQRIQVGFDEGLRALGRYDEEKEGNIFGFIFMRVKGSFVDMDRETMRRSGLSRGTYQRLKSVVVEGDIKQTEANVRAALKAGKLKERDLRFLEDGAIVVPPSVSLETAEGEPDETGNINTGVQLVADTDTFAEANSRIMQQQVWEAMKHLDPRERLVIGHTFGIAGYEPLTGVEIGKKIGLSESSIVKIKRRAFEKMKPFLSPLQDEAVNE